MANTTSIQEKRAAQMNAIGFKFYDFYSGSYLMQRVDGKVKTKVQVQSDGNVKPAPF